MLMAVLKLGETFAKDFPDNFFNEQLNQLSMLDSFLRSLIPSFLLSFLGTRSIGMHSSGHRWMHPIPYLKIDTFGGFTKFIFHVC